MITAKVMFIECARRKGTVKYVLHITTLLKHIPGAHSKHLKIKDLATWTPRRKD
jgi:hypothetical protein